ncbi:hypothetical protein Tco_1329601 [Tanacetum coccineum]
MSGTTTPSPNCNHKPLMFTNAQLQAMINEGVSAALAARDATRNGTDSHSSGTGVRGSERIARECTYQDFMKCKPLYFKGTEGVVELTQWLKDGDCFRISTLGESQDQVLLLVRLSKMDNRIDGQAESVTIAEETKLRETRGS